VSLIFLRLLLGTFACGGGWALTGCEKAQEGVIPTAGPKPLVTLRFDKLVGDNGTFQLQNSSQDTLRFVGLRESSGILLPMPNAYELKCRRKSADSDWKDIPTRSAVWERTDRVEVAPDESVTISIDSWYAKGLSPSVCRLEMLFEDGSRLHTDEFSLEWSAG
jgi:hypothetical protein